MNVVTWNVNEARTGTDFDNVYDWTSYVQAAPVDIVLIQEYDFSDPLAGSATAGKRLGLNYQASFVYSRAAHRADGQAGLVTFSRWPIVASRSRLFTNPVQPRAAAEVATQYAFNKGVLIATIDTPVGQITIVNIHGFPFRFYGFDAEDPRAGPVWDDLASELTAAEDPLVVGGDFNTPNRDLVLSRVPGVRRAVPEAPSLLDDFLLRGIDAAESTMNADTPSDHPLVRLTLAVS